MKNKVLIFWLWFQWKKYVEYFFKKNYIVDWVTKTWLNKQNLFWLESIFNWDDIIKKEKIFFENYDLIIIAINPYNEQDKIINFLLKIWCKSKVIIEKPVSYNFELLEKLKKNNNYYFFIDEIILNNIVIKIFNREKINKIIFIIYDDFKENYIHILEHISASFLLLNEFNKILVKVKLLFNKNTFKNVLKYKILLDKKYILYYNKWDLFLNNKKIKSLFFNESLDYILTLKSDNNNIIKNNFIYLRKYLNNL